MAKTKKSKPLDRQVLPSQKDFERTNKRNKELEKSRAINLKKAKAKSTRKEDSGESV
jgi:hypothetical protein